MLSATIDRFSYATIRSAEGDTLRVTSLDLATVFDYDPAAIPLRDTANTHLINACLRRLGLDHLRQSRGLELYLETEAPPGSGLGGSSALVVAVIAAVARWRGLRVPPYELARLAWEIERKDVGIPGGLQDQYSAVFGGFNFIEFHSSTDVVVNPLRIQQPILDELQYNLMLVYTGQARVGSKIIDSQIAGYVSRSPGVAAANHRMKELTVQAKDALVTGRLTEFARILHRTWLEKKLTSHHVSTEIIDRMYEEAIRAGALGGKVSGAGGGGFMLIYSPFDRKPLVAERLRALGAQVFPVAFVSYGVEAWTAQAVVA